MSEDEILTDPGASFWLKEQVRASRARDVIDAMNDAEALLDVLKERFARSIGDPALRKRIGR